jgi:hypothetical protein
MPTATTLTSKERILTAMRGGMPDRVPVQLGVFSIAPRMAKGTHWDVYYHHRHDLAALMVEMAETFDFDGYLYTGIGGTMAGDRRSWQTTVVRQDEEFIVTRTTVSTVTGSTIRTSSTTSCIFRSSSFWYIIVATSSSNTRPTLSGRPRTGGDISSS